MTRGDLVLLDGDLHVEGRGGVLHRLDQPDGDSLLSASTRARLPLVGTLDLDRVAPVVALVPGDVVRWPRDPYFGETLEVVEGDDEPYVLTARRADGERVAIDVSDMLHVFVEMRR